MSMVMNHGGAEAGSNAEEEWLLGVSRRDRDSAR